SWTRAADGWAPGNMSINTTWTGVPDIARATVPTVKPSPAVHGSTVTIDLPRADSGYTHGVTWESGSMSGTIGTGLGASTTWTVPNVMAQHPGQALAPIVITVVTKSGATVIGERQVTLL